jgi:thymidylate synthase (FAD)
MSQIIVQLNPDVQPSGSDLAVCNAARRSFGKRSDWGYPPNDTTGYRGGLLDKNKRLIEFLARGMTADDFEQFVNDVSVHGYEACYNADLYELDLLKDKMWQWRNTPEHDTPFNHCFISFEIKAPIFVRAQLVKHEYTIMSEFSRRYITDDIEFYQPEAWRAAAADKKQGSGADLDWVHEPYCYKVCLDNYNFMLKTGIAPEQARMVLPQSLMTSWTWSGTLGAMAKVCRLRLGQDAQAETRYIAEEIYKHLCTYYPVSAPALVKGC